VFFRLLIACAISFVIFLAIHKKRYQWKYFLNDIKTALFLISTLLFLTPVFKSLTVSYSEDTIILLVVSKHCFSFNSLSLRDIAPLAL